MISSQVCYEILDDLSHLQLSRQKNPNDTISLDQIKPIALKIDNLVQGLKIGHNDDTKVVFKYLVYPLAKEIIRQNIRDLEDLIKETSTNQDNLKGPSDREILEGKKYWFEESTKSAWELFAAILGIKTQPDMEKFKLFMGLA